MVDPNPARGMPLQLQKYWLLGKGAAKIRWHMPHDFNRCVRQLRKYFPKNPEGLCNILHTKALGAPPGKGHGDALALTAAAELMARQPELGKYLWAGPLAPIGRDTEEARFKRRFDPGALRHRMLPLPLDFRERQGPGHGGALTVGRILGVSYGPDHKGSEHAWGWGDYLDEEIIPEARKARYLMEMGVVGASIDPGGRVVASVNPEDGGQFISEYTMGGATLVTIPAFSRMRLFSLNEDGDWPDDDEDMVMEFLGDEDECMSCGDKAAKKRVVALSPMGSMFSVNPEGWRGLPLAIRESQFDNDDAVKRITAWAQVSAQGADVTKLRQAFLWHDDQQPETNPGSYRLPVGDIINGELTLIYHAIYAAAALISGAHGGLPDVPDEDKVKLRGVISGIYELMAKEFNDPNMRAPWDNPAAGAATAEGYQPQPQQGNFAAYQEDEMSSPKEPYGDVAYADPGYQVDKKKRYPIDTPEHCRAAWSYINQADNAAKYTPKQLRAVKARIMAAAKKAGITISEKAMTASASQFPTNPPRNWFRDPKLNGRTSLTVTEDGRVFGHIAAWGECHRDFNECVLAPKSRMGYRPFHLGQVRTAEDETIRAGKIVMDTRHADVRLGYAATAIHYDDTGDEIAVVCAGEDEFGIWVAGAVVPEATPQQVAKLRRSPISGDWRAVEGNLELVAALAVNVPAFPVYSMEGEERFSLIAAGMVMPDPGSINRSKSDADGFVAVDEDDDGFYEEDEDEDAVRALAALFASVTEEEMADDDDLELDEDEEYDEAEDSGDADDEDDADDEYSARQELWTRLSDLQEDEDIYAQRELVDRFALLAAAEAAVIPAPAPAPAAPPAPVTPTPAAPAPAAAAAAQQGMSGEQLASLPEDQRISYMNSLGRFSVIAEDRDDVPDEEEPPVEQTAPVPAAGVPAPPPAAPAPAPTAPPA